MNDVGVPPAFKYVVVVVVIVVPNRNPVPVQRRYIRFEFVVEFSRHHNIPPVRDESLNQHETEYPAVFAGNAGRLTYDVELNVLYKLAVPVADVVVVNVAMEPTNVASATAIPLW